MESANSTAIPTEMENLSQNIELFMNDSVLSNPEMHQYTKHTQ